MWQGWRLVADANLDRLHREEVILRAIIVCRSPDDGGERDEVVWRSEWRKKDCLALIVRWHGSKAAYQSVTGTVASGSSGKSEIRHRHTVIIQVFGGLCYKYQVASMTVLKGDFQGPKICFWPESWPVLRHIDSRVMELYREHRTDSNGLEPTGAPKMIPAARRLLRGSLSFLLLSSPPLPLQHASLIFQPMPSNAHLKLSSLASSCQDMFIWSFDVSNFDASSFNASSLIPPSCYLGNSSLEIWPANYLQVGKHSVRMIKLQDNIIGIFKFSQVLGCTSSQHKHGLCILRLQLQLLTGWLWLWFFLAVLGFLLLLLSYNCIIHVLKYYSMQYIIVSVFRVGPGLKARGLGRAWVGENLRPDPTIGLEAGSGRAWA
ncbi:hypothetical protein B0H11DRAFT_2208847 [Mycena galericulata]|nr:hypothetical protein B0H11DRAFT_2208847 [Mycena galericulata]